MEQFASGWKRSYYGKGDVIVYRLNRDGKSPAGGSPVFGANILMLLYGDAFWPTYHGIKKDGKITFINNCVLAYDFRQHLRM